MSGLPEILSDQKIFHRWQFCPFEYFLVCHFVHPGYPHDRTQVSHHEGMQLFTCRLYTVQGSAPYRRVDSMIARYILPLTSMDTWWLFQNLWRSRPKDALALAIHYDIIVSGSCRVGLVQHLGLLDVNLHAERF